MAKLLHEYATRMKDTRDMRRLFLALLLLLIVAAVRPALASGQGPAVRHDDEVSDYVIGPEDVLDIAVWDNEQVSRTVPVRPDGKISLPLLDDVKAAGLTPTQLRDFLKTALTPYIPIPAVSVIVREIHSFKVTVMGEVKAPGQYELRRRSTVLDVLAQAGGFTEYAARGRIVVLRRAGAGTKQLAFAFDKLLAGTSRNGSSTANDHVARHNFDVAPGDIILVP